MDTDTASIGLFSGGQVAPERMTIARRIARSPSFFMLMVTSFRDEKELVTCLRCRSGPLAGTVGLSQV
jgi:hypothetical protein